MFEKKYAHIDQGNKLKRQLLIHHLINTGIECQKIGKKIDLEKVSLLLGCLHDLGKIQKAFQDKLKNSSQAHVDHSSLGGAFILKIQEDFFNHGDQEEWQEFYTAFQEDRLDILDLGDYTSSLIYVIMSHHSQYDLVRKNQKNTYEYVSLARAHKIELDKSIDLQEIYWEGLLAFKEKGIDLKNLYREGFLEYSRLIKKLENLAEETSEDKEEALYFYKSMVIRLLVSILKSADIKDSINSYEKIIQDIDLDVRKALVDRFKENVDEKYASFDLDETTLNMARNKISQAILDRALEDQVGIYRLDLPTGAGKTLLSLSYGVNQMQKQGKERFFYVTSYLSVLEQNAEEMKAILKNREEVLEHHSNVVNEEEKDQTDDLDDALEFIRKKYLMDDWSSPVVLTTMVQFFNSIFKGKSANLTRFKSMISSVIILDELQSLPTEVLYITNLALNFIKVAMKATIVLSTATQPSYSYKGLKHRLSYGDLQGRKKDLVSLSVKDLKTFERVELKIFKDPLEEYSLKSLEELALSHKDDSTLIILNTKSVVKKLYNLLKESNLNNDIYYLTTNLTAYHRLKRIKEIKERLEKGDKICVVSTQLIEAGVDVDFACVIRSLTGMDSVIQAMGRCNREGKRPVSYTYLVNLDRNEEKITPMKEMVERKTASKLVLHESGEGFDLNKVTEKYFDKLYANLKAKDLSELLGLLGRNEEIRDQFYKERSGDLWEKTLYLNLLPSFKTAYNSFQLIEDNQKTAVVEYKETKNDLNQIRDLEQDFFRTYDFSNLVKVKAIMKNLSRHTVTIRDQDLVNCEQILDGMVYVVSVGNYDETFGLNFDSPGLPTY